MIERLQASDHDAIDLLLPWYLNKTLDESDHEAVTQHLDECAECREHVALLTRIQMAVNTSTATPIVPKPPVEAFLDSLDARHLTDRRRIRSWMVAASLAILALTSLAYFAGRISMLQAPSMYETATSAVQANTMDYVLIVRFGEDTLPADRARVFEEIGARSVSPSGQDAAYRVIIPLSVSTIEEVQDHTNGIASRPEVESVEVVAVQLPVRLDI